MIAFLSSAGAIVLKIIIAFIIFLLGLIIGKFAGIIITKLLYELKIDQILETIGVKFFFSSAAGSLISFLIYVAGLIFALNQLGLAAIVTIVLGAFFSVIILVALFLGATNAARNFFIGIYMRKKFFGKKTIDAPVKGKILHMGYTGLKVITGEKDVLVIPFSAFVKD
jgi:hypothetical protein